MPYRYGRGFGLRGASPPWPYVGLGRGGLPRCWYFPGPAAPVYGQPGRAGAYPASGPAPYPGAMTREQELDFLRSQAQAIKSQLEQIDARIKELGEEKE